MAALFQASVLIELEVKIITCFESLSLAFKALVEY